MKTVGSSPGGEAAAEADVGRNLAHVLSEIKGAVARAGRPDGCVRLVAVSKTQPSTAIALAAAAGQADFGENYAQEAAGKIAEFPRLRFHFIGGLQSNKAKLVVGSTCLIHSVDRPRLAQEISALAVGLGRPQEALVQVRIGDEETKSGASLEQALDMVRRPLPGLRWRGVMCLPPVVTEEATGRGFFRRTQAAFEKLRAALPDGRESFDELSMGTSHDFTWAIAEGATLVRVGTAIFGARPSALSESSPPDR